MITGFSGTPGKGKSSEAVLKLVEKIMKDSPFTTPSTKDIDHQPPQNPSKNQE